MEVYKNDSTEAALAVAGPKGSTDTPSGGV